MPVHLTELDARYTKELADANATIESLRADVCAGRKRLQVAATCAKSTTGASSMGDGESPRLTADKAFQAQTDAQVAAANVVKILASADSQQKSDIREALKLLGQFQQQQGDNARADAELVLKSQAQGHAQRMDISSILQKSTQQQPQQ
ncbi:hypothetical protein DAE08_12105 [Escherichia coli]|nr:hypothetical protein [Escherichia coli]